MSRIRPYHKETWQRLANEMLANKTTTKSEFESAYIALHREDPALGEKLKVAAKNAPDWRKLVGAKVLKVLNEKTP